MTTKTQTTPITRAQYMENSDELHHAYYLQFATPATRNFVVTHIGMEKLLACEDQKHLNGCVRWTNGGRTWLWDGAPINATLARELGESICLSTHTCVGKAAARELIAEHNAKLGV